MLVLCELFGYIMLVKYRKNMCYGHKNMIRECCEHLHAHKFDKLDEMD